MSTLKVNRIEPRTGDTIEIVGFNAGGGLQSVQTFTTSGTWTKPDGITKVIVEVQGAGGGGKRKDVSPYGSNGGSGAYAKKLIDVSSISSANIVVGSAGARGASASVDGGAGGTSSWEDGTNTITANGGAGGTDTLIPTGPAASGGDININGGPSVSCRNIPDVNGYDTPLGLGGRLLQTANSAPPTGYGGSGSGSDRNASNTDGGAGIVIIWEYA